MDLDVTLLIQLALLAILMVVLSRGLFSPLLAIIEERHQKIHGTRHEVERLERLTAADREAYETRVRQARRAAQSEREHQRTAGRDEARRLLAEARASIARAMNDTREKVNASESAARATLQGDVESLARELARKLLGREAT